MMEVTCCCASMGDAVHILFLLVLCLDQMGNFGRQWLATYFVIVWMIQVFIEDQKRYVKHYVTEC